MAAVSFVRITTKREPVTDARLREVRGQIADAFGQIGVQEIRANIWAESRFKRTTGKSTKAWAFKVERDAAGLIVYNTAVNRYGFNYPKVVHLAGRPKSDRLMLEVEKYMREDHAKRLGRALAHAGIKAKKAGRLVTTKEVFRG